MGTCRIRVSWLTFCRPSARPVLEHRGCELTGTGKCTWISELLDRDAAQRREGSGAWARVPAAWAGDSSLAAQSLRGACLESLCASLG